MASLTNVTVVLGPMALLTNVTVVLGPMALSKDVQGRPRGLPSRPKDVQGRPRGLPSRPYCGEGVLEDPFPVQYLSPEAC